MKRGVFKMTWKQNDRACSGEHSIHLGLKKHTSWSQVKTMLVCFFNHKGIVHYEVTAQGQMVNQQRYLEVLTRLRESVRRKSLNSGLIIGFSTITMPLRMMC